MKIKIDVKNNGYLKVLSLCWSRGPLLTWTFWPEFKSNWIFEASRSRKPRKFTGVRPWEPDFLTTCWAQTTWRQSCGQQVLVWKVLARAGLFRPTSVGHNFSDLLCYLLWIIVARTIWPQYFGLKQGVGLAWDGLTHRISALVSKGLLFKGGKRRPTYQHRIQDNCLVDVIAENGVWHQKTTGRSMCYLCVG